ncbi:MAG TPA: hypothetical protein VEJ18_13975, partial [Planctomycetota bacterium]|nr:hypothetical protein [Planctomycetota bacterium]
MLLHFVRAIFVGVCGAVGAAIGADLYKSKDYALAYGLAAGLLVGLLLAGLSMAFTRRLASAVSTVMFGLLVGCLVSYFVVKVLALVWPSSDVVDTYRNFALTVAISFVTVITLLQLKDDLKFVIPLVEFRREGQSSKPVVLDTSVIIDGRIAGVMDSKILDVPV